MGKKKGKRKVKNVTINLNSLVENLIIHSSDMENKELEEKIIAKLSATLNGTPLV